MIDHLKRGWIKLGDIKVLVLDEADRMIDTGFAPQLEEIIERLPKMRQTLLFSATMPREILKLASAHMVPPIHIEIASSGTIVDSVDQEMHVVRKENKHSHLEKILSQHTGSVLVFTRTKHGARSLAEI